MKEWRNSLRAMHCLLVEWPLEFRAWLYLEWFYHVHYTWWLNEYQSKQPSKQTSNQTNKAPKSTQVPPLLKAFDAFNDNHNIFILAKREIIQE